MPIYEYKCKKCNHIFEELVSSGKGKIYSCPKCSSENTSKIMSVVGGISTKGSKDLSSSCASAPMCPSAAKGCCGPGGCMMN